MDDVVNRAAEALTRLRRERPLVLSITNSVVTNWTANCLLALGAKPAMLEEPNEAAQLAARAGAVLVNLGTVTAQQFQAMRVAATSANAANVPWVLDPVAVDKLTYRRTLATSLIAQKPRLIRGNSDEINFLLGSVPHFQGSVPILSTGPVDEIWGSVPIRIHTGGSVPIRIANGVEMLTRVTGTGCAQGAIAAAFCAVEADPVVAAVATSLTMGIAGEMAFEKAPRPGSFQIALLDALDELNAQVLMRKAKVL